ncbi:MAG TPA: UDP-N-acetylmuramoyl-L-alanine--D-glutamate ligase [Anaerolineales bacterium]|nr:UDP-N-acetylmuramoyl-L-alanine--D-glutamate ligase [Anaerolineales bacterium]
MQDWTGVHVVVIGAARQGTALARFLAGRGAAVILNDGRPPAELADTRAQLADLPVEWVLGGHPLRILDGAGLVCPSGGVPLDLPLVAEARRRRIALSNDSQIFLDAAPCPTIGITGSAGKTTTTTLAGRILEADGAGRRRTWVGGNIGNPLIGVLDEIAADDLAVIELSSFQLELMRSSPQIAAVLNLTPNHLDRHGTMAAYAAAKANILNFQTGSGTAVLGRDDPGARSLLPHVKGRLATFGIGAPAAAGQPLQPTSFDVHVHEGEIVLASGGERTAVMPLAEVELRGEHNLRNVLAACAIAHAAGAGAEAMRSGVRGFRGVEHRLEFVRSWGGADWYNDSIATAPERAMAALRSFEAPVVLLAGGKDKDLPWEDFARLIVKRVRHLVAFGETAGMIAGLVRSAGDGPDTISTHRGLREAVAAAAAAVSPGDVVLLSPGGASFDEFKDFAERGAFFKRWVSELP